MYDVIFKNARVLDGTGAPWFRADVAVSNGFIVRVGKVEGAARETVDATGLYLCPGFIDAHSHSDLPLVENPTADSKVLQGVTIEVTGQCGSSAAPRGLGLRKRNRDGQAGAGTASTGATASTKDEQDTPPRWTDMVSYMDLLESQGISLNVAPLVGHGTVRRQVMGSERRPPTNEELHMMKKLVSQALEQGAFGLSTGLIYVPGRFSDTAEIIELAKVVAQHGGVYFTHMRNEGPRLKEGLEEAIRIGNEANVPVQISHFKVMGQANWGTIGDAIAMVERAREACLDITADQYPYIASSTGLGSPVPVSTLGEPGVRQKALEALKARGNWDKIVVASLGNPDDQRFTGKSIREAGQMQGVSSAEAALGLLERNRGVVQIVNFAMSEDDVRTVMRVPWAMAGSDGRAYNIKTATGQPHPRSYGTFVRILGRYVREYGVLRLEEAVRKMTSLPAMRLGLQDRGILREGMRADLVLFDAETVVDNATFAEPHRYPSGVSRVLVNGVTVVENGVHTGRRPGLVLRRTG